jgi:transcriptional regulator with XRE-family HTH domain
MSNIDDQLDAIIDAHIRYLEGDGPAPDLAGLPDELRDQAHARVVLLEAMWGAELQPPADDPVARRFGFDRPGQDIAIDGRRVAALRKAAGIDLTELLARVTAAGGTINAGTLFRLEQNASTLMTQPTVSAIVAALNVALTDIESADEVNLSPVRAFLDSPAFYELIDDWSGKYGRQRDEVRSVVAQRVLAAQYRAEDITVDHLVEIVQAILDSLEP